MSMIRKETRTVMMKLRSSLRSSRATISLASAAQKSNTSPETDQQRRLLSTVTVHTRTTIRESVPSMARIEDIPRVAVRDVAPHSLVECTIINGGKQVVLEFADKSKYEVHSSWLKDSHPSNRGLDFYRTSALDVWKLSEFTISEGLPVMDGQQLKVVYKANVKICSDTFEAKWLHGFMPFVGKALHSSRASVPNIKGTGSMLESLFKKRQPWRNNMEMPMFDAKSLAECEDIQIKFLENMICPGVALITDVGTPKRLEREYAGKPMEELVFKFIGKLNQHPVRSTNYGVMYKTAESAKQSIDYDMNNPLSMHTDHSPYSNTPGFLQFLYQAQGSVCSKVCDGLALAEHIREHYPKYWKLLTTVEITHSFRSILYSAQGAPRSTCDQSTPPASYELVHTHPIIKIDPDGIVEQVVQSETKRGVSALPYETYENFMEAYKFWMALCEDSHFIKNFDWPEGTMLALNNYRTLHGRASVPPEVARTMCFGYTHKTLMDNRYRLLKQNRSLRSNPAMDDRWLTCIPNQVLDWILTEREKHSGTSRAGGAGD